MNLLWLLVVLLIVMSITGAPSIGVWNHGYGWGPSGLGVILVIILLVLLLTGRL